MVQVDEDVFEAADALLDGELLLLRLLPRLHVDRQLALLQLEVLEHEDDRDGEPERRQHGDDRDQRLEHLVVHGDRERIRGEMISPAAKKKAAGSSSPGGP
jgi:hypothetical protein